VTEKTVTEKTVAAKLLVKPASAVWVSDPARLPLLGPLPEGARSVSSLAEASIAVLFADDAATLRALTGRHGDELAGPAILWALYPKGNRADINRDTLYPLLTPYGIRPNGQVSVDDVWSALRFRPNKPGETEFTGGGRR